MYRPRQLGTPSEWLLRPLHALRHHEDIGPIPGLGTSFLDFETHGQFDLLFVDGHIYPPADPLDWGAPYSPLLFRNLRTSELEEVPALGVPDVPDAGGMYQHRDVLSGGSDVSP